MKNIKRVAILIALLGTALTAWFMLFIKNTPNVFDWDLEDDEQ